MQCLHSLVVNVDITPQGHFRTVGDKFVKKRDNNCKQAQNEHVHADHLKKVTSGHIHLATLLDVILQPTYIATVMELVDGTDAIDAIANPRHNRMALFDTMHVQIGSAIAYLHQNGCYHLDVKLDNILYSYRNRTHVCTLSDYGSATRYAYIQSSAAIGTARYQAPEIVLFANVSLQSEKLDTYAFGATLLYALLNAFPPTQFLTHWFTSYKLSLKDPTLRDCTWNFADLMVWWVVNSPTRSFRKRYETVRPMLYFDPRRRTM